MPLFALLAYEAVLFIWMQLELRQHLAYTERLYYLTRLELYHLQTIISSLCTLGEVDEVELETSPFQFISKIKTTSDYGANISLSFFRCGQTSISVTSDLSTRSSASLYEEQFEDYGEGEEPDYTPSSPCPDDEARTNGYSDLGSSVPSRWERAKEKHFFSCWGTRNYKTMFYIHNYIQC